MTDTDADSNREPVHSDDAENLRAKHLVAWLESQSHAQCATCGRSLCAHELLCAYGLGFRADPLCTECAAREIGQADVDGLRRHLRAHFARRSCFAAAWAWSNAREPECAAHAILPLEVVQSSAHTDSDLVDARWNAGDLGCGDLVLELRMRLAKLAPHEVFELTATDPGARADLPAWCAMTGHALISAAHPTYRIRRRP